MTRPRLSLATVRCSAQRLQPQLGQADQQRFSTLLALPQHQRLYTRRIVRQYA